MDILRDGDFRYTLKVESRGSGYSGYVLRLKQPAGDARMPRVAVRFDLPGPFPDTTAAYRAGLEVAERMVAGELRALVPEVKKRVKEYDLFASALFQIQTERWEPALRIVSRRAANKGAEQDFNGEQTPLQRNHCPTRERASDYAFEYGERLVLGAVPGLRV